MKDCFVYNPFITETFEPVFKVTEEMYSIQPNTFLLFSAQN